MLSVSESFSRVQINNQLSHFATKASKSWNKILKKRKPMNNLNLSLIKIIKNISMVFIKIWLTIVFWKSKDKRSGQAILNFFWLTMIRWLSLFLLKYLQRKLDLVQAILIRLMMDLMLRKKHKLNNMILLLWTWICPWWMDLRRLKILKTFIPKIANRFLRLPLFYKINSLRILLLCLDPNLINNFLTYAKNLASMIISLSH